MRGGGRQTKSRHTGALSFSIVSTLFFGGVFKFNPTLFNVHLGLSIYIMVGRGHSRCQESDKDSARKGVSTS